MSFLCRERISTAHCFSDYVTNYVTPNDACILDVAKFPTATFEITGVKAIEGADYNTEISGNLDFRGVPKNVTFKANVTVDANGVSIKSEEFAINRKDFGISFTGAGGSIVKDEVLLQVDLNAKAAATPAK